MLNSANSDAASSSAAIPPQTHLDAAGFETLCTHFAENSRGQLGAAVPPIYQASTFLFPDAESYADRDNPNRQFEYTRTGNPTTAILERKLARLESGTWARACGSGMGAITAAITSCLHAGAHVVAVAHCYWPTQRYFRTTMQRFGIETTFVNSTKTADFVEALRPNTKLLYLESPSSGSFQILDVPELAAAARARGIRTIFDNSWATPIFQRPLELGCDLVVHSATKFIGGHSDVVAGIVVGRDPALRPDVYTECELLGATLDPFAAWLLIRGLRTLPLRMRQHQESALAIARFLAEHPRVQRVMHPGLPTHPQYELARRQMSGASSLFSFALHEQSRDATHRFLNRLKLFGIGVSWGGHESLALGGDFFSHGDEWLIRLHVGLETVADLIADLRQALED